MKPFKHVQTSAGPKASNRKSKSGTFHTQAQNSSTARFAFSLILVISLANALLGSSCSLRIATSCVSIHWASDGRKQMQEDHMFQNPLAQGWVGLMICIHALVKNHASLFPIRELCDKGACSDGGCHATDKHHPSDPKPCAHVSCAHARVERASAK